VRVLFKVVGDESLSVLGWFVDDVRLNSCASRVPTGTTLTSIRTAANAVALAWKPASYVGSGVANYKIVTGSGLILRTVSSTARSVTVTGLNARNRVTLYVRPANSYGELGSGAGVSIWPTTSTVTTSVTRAKKNRAFVVTARVVESTRPYAGSGMPVVLQRRLATSSVWTNVITGTTNSRGLKGWAVRQKKATYYRVVARGVRNSFGSTSAARLVRKR
jgi:hypothetical protein